MRAGRCFAEMVAVLVAVNVIRALGWFGPPAVPAAVVVAAVVLIAWLNGATPADLGLRRSDLRAGLGYGLAALALVAVIVVGGALIPWTNSAYHDTRADTSGGGLVYELVVSVLLVTVVPEELAFRGLLLGSGVRLWRSLRAVLITSALFGLWHIAPTLHTIADNSATSGLSGTAAGRAVAVAGAVLATFVAGVVFCWLRLRSGSLLASVIAHFATNGVALVVAWVVTL
jgi:membrane protease YdiL (CAAX protease family)